jgi:hypothetical protein
MVIEKVIFLNSVSPTIAGALPRARGLRVFVRRFSSLCSSSLVCIADHTCGFGSPPRASESIADAFGVCSPEHSPQIKSAVAREQRQRMRSSKSPAKPTEHRADGGDDPVATTESPSSSKSPQQQPNPFTCSLDEAAWDVDGDDNSLESSSQEPEQKDGDCPPPPCNQDDDDELDRYLDELLEEESRQLQLQMEQELDRLLLKKMDEEFESLVLQEEEEEEEEEDLWSIADETGCEDVDPWMELNASFDRFTLTREERGKLSAKEQRRSQRINQRPDAPASIESINAAIQQAVDNFRSSHQTAAS